MKILITGITGVYGRELSTRLRRAGHDVVGMARRPPKGLDRGVGYVQGDVADPDAVVRAMEGCDVVAHLAFVVSPIQSAEQTRAINIGGTTNVLDAMERTGCGRLVFASSVLAYGSNPDNPPVFFEDTERRPDPAFVYASMKRDVEDLIAARGVDAVITRTAASVGRDADNMILDVFGGPAVVGVKDLDVAFQFAHAEDVGRFLALACVGDGPTGPVNVAPSDALPLDEIADMLGKRYVPVSHDRLVAAAGFLWKHDLAAITPGEASALSYLPTVDTTKMREGWGFECAWSTREGILDMRHGLAGRLVLGKAQVRVPWQLRYPTRRVVLGEPADDDGARPSAPAEPGELDTTHALRSPVFARVLAGDGPLDALPLTLGADLLRAAVACVRDAFGLADEAGGAVGAAGIFGHRLYADERALDVAGATAARRRAVAAGYPRAVGRVVADDPMAIDPGPGGIAGLVDARLEAALGALRDGLAWAWGVAAVGAALDGDGLTALAALAADLTDGAPAAVPEDAPGRRARARGIAAARSREIAALLDAAVRERARRLADAGVLDDAADVEHLTWLELLDPPTDAGATVDRRREEHRRLAAEAVPATVSVLRPGAPALGGAEVAA